MPSTPPEFSDVHICSIYVQKMLDENNIQPKKTKLQFVWGEFVTLVAQVLVFGFAFALASNFFEDKNQTVQIFSAKVGRESFSELWKLGIGILIVIGLLEVVSKALPSARSYIDDFIFEIPRAIYAFGASATAACMCLAFYLRAHPVEKVGVSAGAALHIGLGLLAVSFFYGCALSFVFQKTKLK